MKNLLSLEALEELAEVGVDAVDVTTTPRYHHTVAIENLERGWHTMVEKPMGLTVRACNLIRRAADASDAILSVAENYRRDPMNRLAKALLDAEVIGTPRLLIHHAIGGSKPHAYLRLATSERPERRVTRCWCSLC